LRNLLIITCKNSRVTFVEVQDTEDSTLSRRVGGSRLDSEDRLSGHDDESTISRKLKRVRELDTLCNSYLLSAKENSISDWSTVCYSQGLQTPQCVRALRKARKEKEAENEKKSKKTGGAAEPTPGPALSTF
jgi:hypothetical protein